MHEQISMSHLEANTKKLPKLEIDSTLVSKIKKMNQINPSDQQSSVQAPNPQFHSINSANLQPSPIDVDLRQFSD